MAKSDLTIEVVSKAECAKILMKWHYLKDISKGFKSGVNYGLKLDGDIVGVCIFTGFPVPELAKGLFGLERSDQKGLFELSRLCLSPDIQENEHNVASWFVSRAIKKLRKTYARAILSYADDDFHKGTVYRASNFAYYGLTDKKKDFWILQDDGSYKKHSRGKTKGIKGEWRDRSRKHRFLLVFDKKLTPLWEKQQ
ncbi:MAG: hypothetical protein GY820_05660 [Gammaproteobacteria bacterium]|nr:hypothetical protein [Pseudoalteromonas sp.]MCP4486793.1 hypothetical protein [Gammaproteobacteria bacterium]